MSSLYVIELHAVYDRPGKHALFGIFLGSAVGCRAKLRELREQYKAQTEGRGTIHMRWLRNVPPDAIEANAAPLCWMQDGWVSAEELKEGMEL